MNPCLLRVLLACLPALGATVACGAGGPADPPPPDDPAEGGAPPSGAGGGAGAGRYAARAASGEAG